MNKSEIVYKGRIIDVYKDTVTLPNGNTIALDLVKHPGAVAIVPILDDGRVVMIRQYRYAAGGYIYEIPAGKLEPNEDPFTCAKRELLEEIGYKTKDLKKLTAILTTPGFSNEKIHLYLATGLTKDKTDHQKDEVIEVVYFNKNEVENMITCGEIVDAKTIVGLYTAFNSLKSQEKKGA